LSRLQLVVLLATAAACFAVAVSAATLAVSPTLLTLDRSGSSSDITVSNQGTENVRFSVAYYRWRQRPDGSMALSPASDLIVFPLGFSLGALEQRVIRVGFTGSITPTEEAYRIVITQLPSFGEVKMPNTLAVRSAISIPLFVGPSGTVPHVLVDDGGVANRRLQFDLVNSGTAHAVVTGVRLRIVDAGGAAIAEHALSGWYLLPEQPRHYGVLLSSRECALLARVVLSVTFASQLAPLHAELRPQKAC